MAILLHNMVYGNEFNLDLSLTDEQYRDLDLQFDNEYN